LELDQKHESLQEILRGLGSVVVAYSGGVDSTLLLKVAIDTLGAENALACIATGPSLAKSQYNRAVEIAKDLGARLETVEPDEMADTNYAANKADRCFHCKSHLLRLLTGMAGKNNLGSVVCGHNLDDRGDYRPGLRAAELFGVRSPLMEAEFTKDDIRQLSRRLNLPTADIPASPCLASRLSYGLQITERRLKQVEQAEGFLAGLGLVEFRVRHHDTIARIEVHPRDFDKITAEPNRSKIVEKLKSLGFKYVAIDLQGFRSGSLNELLTKEEKQEGR
jgi:uncharacterized protein